MESRTRRARHQLGCRDYPGICLSTPQGTWAVPLSGQVAAGGPLCEAWYYFPIDGLTALRYTDDGVRSCSLTVHG